MKKSDKMKIKQEKMKNKQDKFKLKEEMYKLREEIALKEEQHLIDETEAEIVIVNTCSFIQDAERESVRAILNTIDKNKKIVDNYIEKLKQMITILQQKYLIFDLLRYKYL